MKKEFQETLLNVERILKSRIGTRDSDRALILEYMFEFTDMKNLEPQTQNMIAKAIYTQMPAFETVTRCRRRIQQEGHYISTITTQAQRKAKAKAMRSMFK